MLDLAVVMPIYNEEECIEGVLRSWKDKLDTLSIDYKIIALNDGSKDNTAKVLEVFDNDKNIQVINKQNSGHGPTILTGYRQAVNEAKWVFQIDSDDEMKAEHFNLVWDKRDKYDALFGYRAGRVQGGGRALISAVSRTMVKLFFGSGVKDVNTPYRLMKAKYLSKIIEQIPDNTFAPNVIISGSLAKAKVSIFNTGIPHGERQTGTISIVKWGLVKAAIKSFWQTLWCRPRINKAEIDAAVKEK